MKTRKVIGHVVVQILICAFILESGSSIFLRLSPNALYRARRVLQADSEFGWRVKPNLNTTFEKKTLVSDDGGFRQEISPKKYELLTLGPSSAFGWGVAADETYTAVVSKALGVNAFNASQIGYSVTQGTRLWSKRFRDGIVRPKYAIIAYGINDLDKFRFYGATYESDKSFFSKGPIVAPMLSGLETISNFVTLLSLAATEFGLRYDCDALNDIQQRVPLEDYKQEMTSLISDIEERGISPILVNTPYYLKAKNTEYSEAEITGKYQRVMACASKGSCSEAFQELSGAKQLEPDRVAEDVTKLNQILREIASERKLVYIDAYNLLNTAQIESNYVDPVHPSAPGHALIARQISSELVNFKN